MIELSYNIAPDAHKVIDGRDLAKALISDAYRFLIAYANGCPACTNGLFSAIANEAIDEEWAHMEDGRLRPGAFFCTAQSAEERAEFFTAHKEATKARTVALLEKGEENNSSAAHAHEAGGEFDADIPF